MFADQDGVVSRRQALAAGLSSAAIEARLRSGRWTRVYDGVYATFSGPVPRSAWLWAAVLYAGDGAVLSHRSAAELVGLADPPGPRPGIPDGAPIHVTIPSSRRAKPVPGLVVHRSGRSSVAAHPTRRPPQTRVEETVIDLTQVARTLDEALGWIARACGARLTTASRLAAALDARRKVHWRAELAAALVDVRAGCHSLLELRWVRDVERPHGLPTGTRQHARTRPGGGRWYDDVYYDEYHTLVELDGHAAHPEDARWRDMRRDNAGVTDGLSVLRYGTGDVVGRPCDAAAQLAMVLIRNGWTGTPRACGPTCVVRLVIAEICPGWRGVRVP